MHNFTLLIDSTKNKFEQGIKIWKICTNNHRSSQGKFGSYEKIMQNISYCSKQVPKNQKDVILTCNPEKTSGFRIFSTSNQSAH